MEGKCHKFLKEAGLPSLYEGTKYEMKPKQVGLEVYERYGKVFMKRKIAPSIKYTPDFVVEHEGKTFIIEVKGHLTPRSALAWTIFKHYVKTNNLGYILMMPRTQKEIKECINIIKPNG